MFKRILALFILLCSGTSYGQVQVDIRSSGILSAQGNQNYILWLNDCSVIASAQVLNNGNYQQLTPSSDNQSSSSCQYLFTPDESQYFTPSVRVNFKDGTSEIFSEHFQREENAPNLQLLSVSVVNEDEAQLLSLTFTAQDDIDLSYIAADVSAFKASDLRRVGGVVEQVKPLAFAATHGYSRIYPTSDAQTQFVVNIPIKSGLSQAEIASNTLVLIDAYALDASGNKRFLSSIETAGGNVEEKALSWRVFPEEVLITDVLQSITITPTIHFEFRGETIIQGAGRGVSYISDKPNQVYINSSGVVHLDSKVENTTANIRLNYPGLPELNVPIRVDLSKKLTGLSFAGFEDTPFVLPQLNHSYPLPQIAALFDDGSRILIADQYPIKLTLPEQAEGILSLTGSNIRAEKSVVANSPINLNVSLVGNASISGSLAIEALDAPPTAKLNAPVKVEVGEEIFVSVDADDDVAIHKVNILLNGAIATSLLKPPYQLQFPITQEMLGQALKLEAMAVDSAGQYSEVALKNVLVADKIELDISALAFESPIENQRVIATSPIRYQLARKIGPLKIAHNISLPKIQKVEFFFDGSVIAETLRPKFEVRKIQTEAGAKDYLFEVWTADVRSPESSLKETSAALFARVYSKGKFSDTASRLVRLLQNKRPELLITQPHPLQSVVAGQPMSLKVTVSDDTLYFGTQIEAKLNGQSVLNRRLVDIDKQYLTSVDTPLMIIDESIDIAEDALGDTLELVIKATDYHGETTQSETIHINVKRDQPPTVAITTPIEGANWVAGLPVELMASASDDIAIRQVDFYVNDLKIGTDITPPYTGVYQTPNLTQGVQSLELRAEAFDSSGQLGVSQRVNVTLGFDELPPVVHIVAPAVTGTLAGKAIASVVEGTDELIKISGYDNVGVTGFTLSGIRKNGVQYILTGQASDKVTENDIAIQEIPGGHAFSVVAFTRFPHFQAANAAGADFYDLSAVVKDARGNESASTLKVAVVKDLIAQVSDVKLNKTAYTAQDLLKVSVIANDDVAVEKISLRLLDNKGALLVQKEIQGTSGLTVAANTGARFEIDLASLALANKNQTLTLIAQAFDKSGLASTDWETSVNIIADTTGPISGIEAPIIGSVLLNDVEQSITWSVKDASLINTATLKLNGQIIDIINNISSSFSRNKHYSLSNQSQAVFEIEAKDIFGNSSINRWEYKVNNTLAPSVDILSPVTGERFYEGEQFLAKAKIDDDGYITGVTFEILVNDNIEVVEHVSPTNALDKPVFEFSTSLRFPNVPASAKVELRVSAVDNHKQVGESKLELVGLNDVNPPTVTMLLPEQAQILLPGEGVHIKGSALDDIFVDAINGTLIDHNGVETELEWQSLAREDSIKTVEIPDPITLGSTIVKEQFYTEVSGYPLLAASLWGVEDKTYQLLLKAKDNGINTASSAAIPVTFRADIRPPLINVQSPLGEQVEHQLVKLNVSIQDDVSVARYKVYFPGSETTPIIEDRNVNQKTVEITSNAKPSPLEIDLSDFAPIEGDGKNVSIIIDAWDHRGNKASLSHTFKIVPDSPAKIAVTAQLPEPKVHGGVFFYQTELKDDYASDKQPTLAASIATSFDLLTQNRQAWYLRASGASAEDKSDDSLNIGFSYAEADQAWSLKLNDKTHVQFSLGELILTPMAVELSDTLSLVNTDAASDINFIVRYLTNNQCPQFWEQKTVSAKEGIRIADLLPFGTTEAIIIPEFIDGSSHKFIKRIRLDIEKQSNVQLFPGELELLSVQREQVRLSLELQDSSKETQTSWLSSSRLMRNMGDKRHQVYQSQGEVGVLPLSQVTSNLDIFAVAADRNASSIERQPLTAAVSILVSEDSELPTIEINAPSLSSTLIPGQVLKIDANLDDNAAHLRQLSIYLNDKKLAEQGSVLLQGQHQILLPIEKNLTVGSLASIRLVAEDPSGNMSEQLLQLPVTENTAPKINWKKFESHRAITDSARLNYGEFWVRQGAKFNLDLLVHDDSGLEKLQLIRLLEDGSELLEVEKRYDYACQELPTLKDLAKISASFQYAKTQQYELRLTDNIGQLTRLRFYVHPLANIVPGIRISQPAKDQFIAAGSFNLKARVIMTDDMPLDKNNIQLAIDGVELTQIPAKNISHRLTSVDEQLLEEIYDDFEHNYGTQVAEDYARPDSDNLLVSEYIIAIPIEVIGANQTVTLTAQIADRDQAIGSDEIQFIGAADEIKPQAAILSPVGAELVTEASTVPIEFRGFDNVKVAELTLTTAYGVKSPQGYVKQQYGAPIRSISSIPAKDFEAVTLNNIDTPIYKHLVSIPKISEIYQAFEQITVSDNNRFDLWVKLTAKDHAGNEYQIEQSYAIRVDERPVIDIVTPSNLERVVSGSKLAVNVHAYDDVGIHYVNLRVTHGGAEIYRRKLQSGPYTFVFDVPEIGDSLSDQLVLEVEALDTYGASHEDPDRHLASESLTVTIKQDEPPIVTIATPQRGSEYLEGEHILVQVNALDDIGIDSVGLAVSGLITGQQQLVIARAPYEFLVKVPYGQKGKKISFTATATEKRYKGEARLVSSQTVDVTINEDTSVPELSIVAPLHNAVVSEKGSLEYYIEATDNVEIGNLMLNLYADKNLNGEMEAAELIEQKYLLTAPYSGRIPLGTIASYHGSNTELDSLPMAIDVIASDGANNKNQKRVLFSLRANAKPLVDSIQLLNSEGELAGSLDQITRGRAFVINVLASDAEKGIGSITLYRGINASNDSDYVEVGQDNSAPFEFHQNSESLAVGSKLSYRAIAVDQDGYTSALSAPKSFTIVADKAPEVAIIKPANEQSYIVSGNAIEVFAQVTDDLGVAGIDRVVFLMDDLPVATVTEAYQGDGVSGINNWYKASILPAAGASGVAIQVVAYDKLNQAGFSKVIRLGIVEDTVEPQIVAVLPQMGDILQGGETQLTSVMIKDIGSISQRQVLQEWIREYQDDSGFWHTLASVERELTYDDGRAQELGLGVSEPNQHSYLYWAQFSDGRILSHENKRGERVRVLTRVVTNKHIVEQETIHEVSLPIAEHRFWLPTDNAAMEGRSSPKASAKQVHYGNLSQYGTGRGVQSLTGSWSTWTALDVLQDFSRYESTATKDLDKTPRQFTGLFLADFYDHQQAPDEGERFIFSDLMNGSAEVFRGTITGVSAQSNLVLAAKSGDNCANCSGNSDFTDYLKREIAEFPETGKVYDNQQAELLLFNKRNEDEQFGIPYLLAGTVDLPYNDVYSLAQTGNLALVANGAGGVQVINISELSSAYHVGFIKPDGFVRDVKVVGQYAFITASYQGVVVADLSRPQMPIVATLDTAGIANKISIVGNTAYVTDMGEWDGAGALHTIDITDPVNLNIINTFTLKAKRKDYISAGAYDVEVVGGKAYVSTYYLDQEGKPAEGLVEIIELQQVGMDQIDPSRPVLTHRPVSESDYLATDIALANGRVQLATGKQGIAEIDFPTLTVVSHTPGADTSNIAISGQNIEMYFSSAIPANLNWQEYVTVTQGHPQIGLDISNQFNFGFKTLADGAASTRVMLAQLKDGHELQADSHYFVRVKAGLKPVTGYMLPEEYVFSFTTISALSSGVPEFVSISPTLGDVAGGTEIVIEGRYFDEKIKLELGGLPLVITQLELGKTLTDLDVIRATTIPNYPGPAALRLTNPGSVEVFVPGAFTYVDQLRLSFVSPPFVSVSQQGRNDRVTLIGNGFNPDITLKAYRSDGVGSAVIQKSMAIGFLCTVQRDLIGVLLILVTVSAVLSILS